MESTVVSVYSRTAALLARLFQPHRLCCGCRDDRVDVVRATPLEVAVFRDRPLDERQRGALGLAKFRDAPWAGILDNFSKLDPRVTELQKISRRQNPLPQMNKPWFSTLRWR